MPADHLDLIYGKTLRRAWRKGVEIIVYQARVSPEEIVITHAMPFRL